MPRSGSSYFVAITDELCDAIAQEVQAEVDEFPQELFNNEELSVYRMSLFRKVRVFHLGQFRRTWLEAQSGHTTLYIGNDGKLYEYGPAYIRLDAGNPKRNLIRLRQVGFKCLELGELLLCRELLRQLWAV